MIFVGIGLGLLAADACGEGRGITPLMWAARSGDIDAVTALLDAGAEVDAPDRNTWTALLHALHKRRAAAVRVLLDRGANPNVRTPSGMTPLMMAADDPDPESLCLLLQHGADPHVLGPDGITALTQAVSGGAFTDLIDRPIFGGCRPGAVRALLEHDPALRLPDNDAGRRAIWIARLHGCREVLRIVGAPQ